MPLQGIGGKPKSLTAENAEEVHSRRDSYKLNEEEHVMKSSKTLAVVVLAAICSCLQAQNPAQFVQRSMTKLTLAGAPYRYSGPNIEWLGLEGYGPHDPQGPHYPSHFEVDDAFATAAEMGARVVRSQTMGDTVG